jgi:hypothetical protein
LKSFEQLLSLLATIPDPRRAEGKLYKLRHVLLFSIFAMISGANSYRSLCTYFRVHRQRLNEAFGIPLEERARAHGHPLYLASAQRGGHAKVAAGARLGGSYRHRRRDPLSKKLLRPPPSRTHI